MNNRKHEIRAADLSFSFRRRTTPFHKGMVEPLKSTAPKRRHAVLIVEDHPVFREGLVQILNTEKDLAVCGTADDVPSALRAVERLRPELVLVDIGLPGKSGLDLIKKLRADNREIKLLVVSMHDEALYADRVLRAGGDGYIMKQEDPEEIVHAIRDVLAGRIYVSEAVLKGSTNGSKAATAHVRDKAIANLSDSDLGLLEMFGRGKTNEEIARELKLSLPRVIERSAELRKKLHLRTENALIRYAVCWVEQGEI